VQSTGRAPSVSNGAAFQHPRERAISAEAHEFATYSQSQLATRSIGKNNNVNDNSGGMH